MTVKTLLCTSATIVVVILTSTLLFQSGLVAGSSQCADDEFPCDNGGCIDPALWCDSMEDCSDGSDEKYCKKTGLFAGSDPNKCTSTYFKCKNGPCIPKIGRCDGYANCEDSSDEKDCENVASPLERDELPSSHELEEPEVPESQTPAISKSTTRTTTRRPSVKSEETLLTQLSKHPSNQRPSEIEYSNLKPSEYSRQLKKGRDWLLSQRKSDFGWGDETPRAITALYLSDGQQATVGSDGDMLMKKQLEVQLSLDIARNGTKRMKLADLALYINALMASCKNPTNFYGEDLVQVLRNAVNAAQRQSIFVNPSVYLTLCVNKASEYEDTRKLYSIHTSGNASIGAIGRMDIQALSLLATTCIYSNTKFLTVPMHDSLRMQFLQRMRSGVFPGNVYEASLLFQALQEMKITKRDLLEFILKQQKEDGSFGGILATYLVLPVLAGRSLLRVNEHCSQQSTTDLAPIEVLKNMNRRKIFVKYALNYGNPPELTQTIQMQIPEGISFLDVMRLAQEINPKYRFLLDGNSEDPVVYSIGGIPNDAEKGMFWTLYSASFANKGRNDTGHLNPHVGSIKQLIPHVGDEFVYWMRSI